jgi:hypothetical protein
MVLGLAAANVACTVPDKRHPGVRRRSRRNRTDSVSFSQQRSVRPALEEDEGLRLQVGTDAVGPGSQCEGRVVIACCSIRLDGPGPFGNKYMQQLVV